MPLVSPFRTSFGDVGEIESLLVKLESEGITGWGEAAPWGYPAYSSEWTSGAFSLARDFMAPLLIGADVTSGRSLHDLLSGIKDNRFAKSAFDLAWWDLHAKFRGEPLWRTVGGQSGEACCGADFGVMDTMGELLASVQSAVDQGYRRVKLKYRPGWDFDMVKTVREKFPDLTLHVDCNSAYSLDDLQMFKDLDRFNLAMIEQPLAHDDLVDHAALQAQIETPLCLDESITTIDKARKAIQLKACRWINLKPGRVGGVTHAIEINRLCQSEGIPCWIGGMLESAVGASHCQALATMPNIEYPSDVFPSERFYEQDLASPPLKLSRPSYIKAVAKPGIGVEPDRRLLDQMTQQQASFT